MENVNIIRSDKFKNNAISLVMPLDMDDKVTDYNLLAALLKRGSKKYPTTKAIWEHLQDLYGAVFDIVVTKKGEKLFLNFYIQCIDDSYALKKEKLLNQCLDFLYEVVNNPLVSETGFEQSYFDTEKENLKVLINSRFDNKDSYALERIEELLTEGEPYSIYKYGSIERLNNIKNSDLPKLWDDIKANSGQLLFACGNIEADSIMDKIKGFESSSSRDSSAPKAFVKKDVKEVKEAMDVNQAKLCLGCRTNVTIFNGDYFGLAVMNSILGGGTHSKLFNEVREKNSLAYYSYSFIEKFKGLLIIACGIDPNNFDLAKNICIEQIQAMKKGNITKEELYSAKKKLTSDLRTITDSQYSLMDYISALRAYGIKYDIEDIVRELEKVDIERVVQCANSIELNDIYFMTKE
jgi:predicted Zn-dependent peptidase